MTILFIITILAVWVLILHIMLCKARAGLSRQQRHASLLKQENKNNFEDKLRHCNESDDLRKELAGALSTLDLFLSCVEDLSDHYGDIDIHDKLHHIVELYYNDGFDNPCDTCVNEGRYVYVGKQQVTAKINLDNHEEA